MCFMFGDMQFNTFVLDSKGFENGLVISCTNVHKASLAINLWIIKYTMSFSLRNFFIFHLRQQHILSRSSIV